MVRGVDGLPRCHQMTPLEQSEASSVTVIAWRSMPRAGSLREWSSPGGLACSYVEAGIASFPPPLSPAASPNPHGEREDVRSESACREETDI